MQTGIGNFYKFNIIFNDGTIKEDGAYAINEDNAVNEIMESWRYYCNKDYKKIQKLELLSVTPGAKY